MKYHLLKLCRRIPLQKVNHRIVYLFMVALISLFSVFGIHNLLPERTIATEAQVQNFCINKPNSTPEELSEEGEKSYNNGHFGKAIDCWKEAIAEYKKLGNETEMINYNRIKLAQAEQALGLFPRACNTLLEIYGEENCKTLLEDKLEDKEDKEEKFFDRTLPQRANSVSEIAGLRTFGKVLRGLGELRRSHEVLSLSLEKTRQPEEKAAIWLDLGNTRRFFSNKQQNLYQRSEEEENLVCTIIGAYEATQAYEEAEKIASNSPSNNIKLQSQLNQLSLVLDLQDWHSNRLNKPNVLKQLFSPTGLFLRNKIAEKCGNDLGLNPPSEYRLTKEISRWLEKQLSKQNQLTQLSQIEELEKQIKELPQTHATVFTRLNFAKNLISLVRDDKDNDLIQIIKKHLDNSIEYANDLGDLNAKSYGYGYLGELYKELKDFESAKKKTYEALKIAQSTAFSSQTEYLWEWQLGRIYKSQFRAERQAQNKQTKQEKSKNLYAAREMYGLAYNTLQSLRRELVTDNPDVQFSFQQNIEEVYRDYVSLLLWNEKPDQEKLSQARKVIASLQAVQLENFLRLACPEYDVEELDKFVENEEQAEKTAVLYPIFLEEEDFEDRRNRIEVVIKLPGQQKLESYFSLIDSNDFKGIENVENFEDYIKKFERDLQEDYTFKEVKEEGEQIYKWLLQGAEGYLKNKNIDTLVFALDTGLRNIPLAALVVNDEIDSQTNQPTYLIDKYAVTLAPSLEVPKTRSNQDSKLRVLAAGLTQLNREKYDPSFREEVNQYRELDFAKKEIEQIKNINDDTEEKNSSQILVDELIDDKFNSDELQDEVKFSNFQIIHLATHGKFSSSPEETFILTYNQQISVNQLDDIFRIQAQNQPEPIELIVLNACETAAGDSRATLGISGVAVRAGARSAIASLWGLDDEITAQFSEKLYKQLVDPSLTKAQALQKAQIELKKNAAFQHPKYWSPYILVGNWL